VLEPDPEKLRNELRQKCSGLAYSVAITLANGDRKMASDWVKKIHWEWVEKHGGERQGMETIEGLKQKLAHLRKMRRDYGI
jgi:hypothetical protein